MKSALPVITLAFLFLICAYAAETYKDSLVAFMGTGTSGIFVYVCLAVVGTVIAPLSALPLVPIASALWGAPLTAVASLFGWSIGGIIAFALSRRYGRPLVEKLITGEKLARMEQKIPEEHQFWPIVMLSMMLPTDVLSYALGLFKNISWKVYAPAMFIGNIPFALIFAYTGTLPFRYQLLLAPIFLIFIFLWTKRELR